VVSWIKYVEEYRCGLFENFQRYLRGRLEKTVKLSSGELSARLIFELHTSGIQVQRFTATQVCSVPVEGHGQSKPADRLAVRVASGCSRI
jgi:hypothetical protein